MLSVGSATIATCSSTRQYDNYSKLILHRFKQNPIQSFAKFDSYSIRSLDFLPQSTDTFLYGNSQGKLSLVSCKQGKLQQVSFFNLPLNSINSIATSISSEVVIAADNSSVFHFQLTPHGTFTQLANWEGHMSHITDVKYFYNSFGNIFLSSSVDGYIRCWSNKMKHSVFDFKVGIYCHSVSFLSADKPEEIVTSSTIQNGENKMYIWDIRNQRTFVQILQGSDSIDYHTPTPTTPSFLDPFAHIISDDSDDEDAYISYHKWSRPKKAPKPELLKPLIELHGDSKTTRVFDSKTKTYKTKFAGHVPSKRIYHIQSVALRSRNHQCSIYPKQQLLSCSTDQSMKLWDCCNTNEVERSFDHENRDDSITPKPCIFKWNPTIICNTSPNGEIQFWNSKSDYSAPFYSKFVTKEASLQCLALNDYDSMLVLGSHNGSIFVLDTQ